MRKVGQARQEIRAGYAGLPAQAAGSRPHAGTGESASGAELAGRLTGAAAGRSGQRRRAAAARRLAGALGIALFALALAACAGGPDSGQRGPTYRGVGRGESFAEALTRAKSDAIQRAVIDMIGPQAEEANRARLESALYRTRNPNAFIYAETMQSVNREVGGTTEGSDTIYEMTVQVNEQAIRRVLRAEGLLGNGEGGTGGDAAASGGGTPSGSRSSGGEAIGAGSGTGTGEPIGSSRSRSGSRSGGAAGGGSAEGSAGSSGSGSGGTAIGSAEGSRGERDPVEAAAQEHDLSERQRTFLRQYIDSMTYMVYFEESNQVDSFILESAVAQANSYLAEQGEHVVESAQVEQLREDRRMVLEQESGRESGVILWVAERLNADLYIEIGARTNSETEGNRHYATANITLSMFETSTGQLLGALNRRSQRTFSTSSAEDAVLNAVQSAVYQAMPNVLQQARRQMAQYVADGVRYQIVVQNTPDARAVSRFRQRLSGEVERLETVTQAADQTVFRAYLYGSLSDLEEALYEVADSVAGFEGLYLVVRRGKSITVNSGM